MSPFTGPIAPESNPPITPQYYQPRQWTIANVVLGRTTTVTTTLQNDYVVGQLVRLLIPATYGCTQLNEQTAYVISVLPGNEVVLTLDSSGGDAFIANPSYGPTPPQIVAVGDVNSGPLNSKGPLHTSPVLQGSFINISPI